MILPKNYALVNYYRLRPIARGVLLHCSKFAVPPLRRIVPIASSRRLAYRFAVHSSQQRKWGSSKEEPHLRFAVLFSLEVECHAA